MRSTRFLWLPTLAWLFFSSGCAYVHFGRIDKPITDATLVSDNSNLRLEKKLLLEELSIARKEGAALRSALDRASATSPQAPQELVAKLNDATRELATLRAGYARLQAEREKLQAGRTAATSATDDSAELVTLKSSLSATEEKLADALHNFTALQQENNRLRLEVDSERTENARLASKIDQLSVQNTEARSALAQLNTELLAQKEARAQAEQSADALRSQLQAMAAVAPSEGPAPSLASARESTAGGAREIDASLHLAIPSTDAKPSTASLSTSPEKLRAAAQREAAASAPSAETVAAPPPPRRIYTVREGDTLERVAEKFYGRKDRWRLLYAANNSQLSGGRPLKPGMELEVPEE